MARIDRVRESYEAITEQLLKFRRALVLVGILPHWMKSRFQRLSISLGRLMGRTFLKEYGGIVRSWSMN